MKLCYKNKRENHKDLFCLLSLVLFHSLKITPIWRNTTPPPDWGNFKWYALKLKVKSVLEGSTNTLQIDKFFVFEIIGQ